MSVPVPGRFLELGQYPACVASAQSLTLNAMSANTYVVGYKIHIVKMLSIARYVMSAIATTLCNVSLCWIIGSLVLAHPTCYTASSRQWRFVGAKLEADPLAVCPNCAYRDLEDGGDCLVGQIFSDKPRYLKLPG